MSESRQNRRRGGNKARTGCITCKFRRVKCDETKPHCLRCINFGRKCDGYGEPKHKANKNGRRKSEGLVVIRPRPLLTSYNPESTIPGNADERRYFQLFSQATAAELRGYLDSMFWSQTVLQASLTEPSIRHAITAIASLSKMAEEIPKTSSPIVMSKVKDEHYRFGLEQYNKAIMSLRAKFSNKENSLRTALIACILFTCIEAIQGDQAAASGQAHSGLNLMQQAHGSRFQKDQNGRQSIIEDEIVQMYVNMNVQSFFLVFSDIPHHPPMCMHPHTQGAHHHVSISPMPRTFTSILEAKRALDLILNSIIQFYTTSTSSTEGKVEKYAHHHARLRQWESSFQPLWNRSKVATNIGLHAKTAPMVLSVYHRVGLIVLAGAIRHEETIYDSLRKDFVYIVSSCRSVLDALTAPNNTSPSSTRPPPRPPRFSFDIGLIPPLYIVASKCRDPPLRRRAIELLKTCPAQEGLWEPFVVSRVCEWMLAVEERGLPGGSEHGGGGGGYVPECARVRLTGMVWELSKRRVWAQCKGVVPETADGLVKVWESYITW